MYHTTYLTDDSYMELKVTRTIGNQTVLSNFFPWTVLDNSFHDNVGMIMKMAIRLMIMKDWMTIGATDDDRAGVMMIMTNAPWQRKLC